LYTTNKKLLINNKNLDLNQQERLNKLVQMENYKFWLSGFIEGEGALVVSIVKNDKVTHGVVLQPEFNVAQHENGINILHSFKVLFNNLGTVHKKSGSDKVWVYSIKGTQNIKNYIIPFFEKYVIEYSCKYESSVFKDFCDIIIRLDFNKNKTIEKEELIELVKLTYNMNPDGKGKQRKRTLEDVINIINEKGTTSNVD
jgi:LAGLIDADG endonuclease